MFLYQWKEEAHTYPIRIGVLIAKIKGGGLPPSEDVLKKMPSVLEGHVFEHLDLPWNVKMKDVCEGDQPASTANLIIGLNMG